MYGADWPASLTGSTYANLVVQVRKALAELADAERGAVPSETARRVYRL